MGRASGAGSPLDFRCVRCRALHCAKERRARKRGQQATTRHLGTVHRVTLTGERKRSRNHRHSARGSRSSEFIREYTCRDCGHVGWSNHIDLARLATYERALNEGVLLCPS